MRTTLAIDDDLFAKARASTGLTGASAVVREALKAIIERESARRLALLGGSAPELQDTPRRRPGDARTAGARPWTRDVRLLAVAGRLGLADPPSPS